MYLQRLECKKTGYPVPVRDKGASPRSDDPQKTHRYRQERGIARYIAHRNFAQPTGNTLDTRVCRFLMSPTLRRTQRDQASEPLQALALWDLPVPRPLFLIMIHNQQPQLSDGA
jgi:hypothetical protein